jgi:hypothetical protein
VENLLGEGEFTRSTGRHPLSTRAFLSHTVRRCSRGVGPAGATTDPTEPRAGRTSSLVALITPALVAPLLGPPRPPVQSAVARVLAAPRAHQPIAPTLEPLAALRTDELRRRDPPSVVERRHPLRVLPTPLPLILGPRFLDWRVSHSSPDLRECLAAFGSTEPFLAPVYLSISFFSRKAGGMFFWAPSKKPTSSSAPAWVVGAADGAKLRVGDVMHFGRRLVAPGFSAAVGVALEDRGAGSAPR